MPASTPNGVPFFWFLPIYFIGLWVSVAYVVGLISGWHLLAQRFQANKEFTGKRFRWFQAAMRWGAHYGNALNIGANPEGLHLASLFLFRIGHAPLFIPWTEITVAPSRWWDLYLSVTLTMGREEQIPFRISKRLAGKLRHSAGIGWPDSQNQLCL